MSSRFPDRADPVLSEPAKRIQLRLPTRSLVCVDRAVVVVTLGLVALTFSGCGTFRGGGQIGPDLRPTLGASVSVPLGK